MHLHIFRVGCVFRVFEDFGIFGMLGELGSFGGSEGFGGFGDLGSFGSFGSFGVRFGRGFKVFQRYFGSFFVECRSILKHFWAR